jgi:hypothetical protein
MHVMSRNVKQRPAVNTRQVVHLNEKKVYPLDRDEDVDAWVLDTGPATT